jgi:transcriptional regulator with XRE-family HTH domain
MKREDVYVGIGAMIRTRRRGLDLSQGELAQTLGLSRSTLANIESGRQRILVHQMLALAAALETTVAELLPLPQATKAISLPKNLNDVQAAQVTNFIDAVQVPRTSSPTLSRDNTRPSRTRPKRR